MSPTATPAHDWLRPRLERLVEDAVAAGIDRDVATAVLTDLITDPSFASGHLAGDTDA